MLTQVDARTIDSALERDGRVERWRRERARTARQSPFSANDTAPNETPFRRTSASTHGW